MENSLNETTQLKSSRLKKILGAGFSSVSNVQDGANGIVLTFATEGSILLPQLNSPPSENFHTKTQIFFEPSAARRCYIYSYYINVFEFLIFSTLMKISYFPSSSPFLLLCRQIRGGGQHIWPACVWKRDR